MWLPPGLGDVQQRERAEMQDLFEVHQTVRHFNADLHDIDPGLELVKAKEHGEVTVPGLRPGYWHLIRREGADATILPLEYDNGEFREPGSWMFDYLREQDLWNDRARTASKKRALDAAAERERDQERHRLSRVDEINERIKSVDNTQIHVPRSL